MLAAGVSIVVRRKVAACPASARRVPFISSGCIDHYAVDMAFSRSSALLLALAVAALVPHVTADWQELATSEQSGPVRGC